MKKNHRTYKEQRLERKIEIIGNVNMSITILFMVIMAIADAKNNQPLFYTSIGVTLIGMIIHMLIFDINDESEDI